MGQRRSAVYHFKGMGGLDNIYYNMSVCDISIFGGKAILECYEDGRFYKFSIKIFINFMPWDLSGHFAIATKWVGMSQDVNTQNGHF